MNYVKSVKSLFFGIENLVLFFLFFFVPLLFSGSLLSVYELPKLMYVSLISAILCGFLLFKKTELKISVLIAALAFFALSYLNLSSSIIPFRSFAGDAIQNDSILALISYLGLVFYFAHSGKLEKTNKSLKFLIFGAVLLGTLTIIHGTLLYFEIIDLSYDGRATATIGQPNLLGGILASVIPIIYGLLKSSKFKSKWNLISLAILFTGVFITGSRGAIIGIAIFAYLEAFSFIRNKKIRISWIVVPFLLFALLVLTPPIDTEKLDLPYNVERFLSFKDRNGLYDKRFDLWGVGIRAFKDRPIFGYGNANFQNVYPMYLDPMNDKKEVLFLEVESSHNQIVDILVETGLIGLLAMSAFFVYVFFIVDSKDFYLSKYIKFAILITFVKGMFEFYSVINYVYAAFFIGSLLAFSNGTIKKALISKLFVLFMIFPLLLSALMFSQIGYSEKFEKASMLEGDFRKSLKLQEEAIKYNPFKQSLFSKYIALLYWSGDIEKMKEKIDIKYAGFDDFKTNFYLGMYYLKKADDRSIESLSKAVSLNKRDPLSYHYLGVLYYARQNYDDSYANFEKTIKLDARNFSDDYVYMADMQIKKGDIQKASELIQKAAPSVNKDAVEERINKYGLFL